MFPDASDATEIHDQALADHSQAPEVLANPALLDSALGRAENYWNYGEGSDEERMADAAAALAHGVGAAQAFTDGNKRTAYHTARYFLHANGYGHLSPLDYDDEELADHLIGHGEGTHSLQDTQALLRSRIPKTSSFSWKIEKVTSEDAWFQDYITEILTSRTPEFPDPVQKVGACTVTWQEIDPSVVRIVAQGGSIDDRSWAEGIVRDQLWHFGYHRAEVYFDHVAAYPSVLYHWTEAGKYPDFARGTTQPGLYLTTASDPATDWNDDIPYLRHPLRVAIDASKLDPANFGQNPLTGEGYGGSPQSALQNSGNVYYTGTIPPEAVMKLEKFDQPQNWDDAWGLGHMPDEHFMSKTAHWDDIMAKAKRLIQSGQVQVLRNGYNNIVGHVIGDHGEYNTEISRDDPNSRAITGWQCECPWDQYAWQRTRQWKKYEGRPCAHVLALYWKSLSTPLDGDVPDGSSPAPGERGPLPGGPPSMGPGGPPGAVVGPPLPQPGGNPAQPSLPGMQPASPDVLPTSPMDQLAMQMNPPVPGATPAGMPAPPGSVSVPGARPPTPFGPVQYPGGTYSKTAADSFLNGNKVRLKKPTYALTEGREGATDAGQYVEIPAGTQGDVMGQDPMTGWVEVIFPLKGGAMTSYHARAFLEPSELSDLGPGTAFIKRAPSS